MEVLINNLLEILLKQIQVNAATNFFYHDITPDATVLYKIKAKSEELLMHADCDLVARTMINSIVKRVLPIFTGVNQFIYFTENDENTLKALYYATFLKIMQCAVQQRLTVAVLGVLFREHYEQLRQFLIVTNGAELFKRYYVEPDLFPVVNANYSAAFQLELLGIDPADLREPVIDVGCGTESYLVKYLETRGCEVYGIDRDAVFGECILASDWFNFDFTSRKWGTIISHMAFSNHFYHHHIRKDGNFIGYAKKYYEMLSALDYGGSFIYTPSLPFIEQALSSNRQYLIAHKTFTHNKKEARISKISKIY